MAIPRQNKSHKLVIFGISTMATLAWYYFSSDSNYEVVAFTVDAAYINDCKEMHGLPAVKFEDVEKIYPPDIYHMFVAIGYSNLNKSRAEKCSQAKGKGYFLTSYISTNAICHITHMGENCFIWDKVVIEPFVSIGNNVYIWSGSQISHHTKIGNNCFIAPQCAIAGNVRIGDFSFIGINATIRDGINIGEKSILGAGTILLNDAPSNSVYIAKETPKAPFESSQLPKI